MGFVTMDLMKIQKFIKRQKVSFICSVDENGCPNVKAMLKPRKINGLKEFYFSTNTSSLFYKKGVTDPDYCVLKFTAESGRYYCDLKTESFEV